MKPVQLRSGCQTGADFLAISTSVFTKQALSTTADCNTPEKERRRDIGTQGFSLLELLLVVAILVLLVTLYWSPGSGSRQRALQAACQRNLQKIYVAMQIFSSDNDGKFPVVNGARTSSDALASLVPKYTSDISSFICPGSKDAVVPGADSLKKQKISYAYYMGRSMTNSPLALITDAQVDVRPKIPGEPLFSADDKPPGNNHGKNGGNLLFTDGHIQTSGPKAALDLPVREGEQLLNP